MVSLSRIQTAAAEDEALARDARTADTIPAPPPSEPREDAPQSRIDSTRRRDTLPSPPPDVDDEDEAAPSTERTLPPAS